MLRPLPDKAALGVESDQPNRESWRGICPRSLCVRAGLEPMGPERDVPCHIIRRSSNSITSLLTSHQRQNCGTPC